MKTKITALALLSLLAGCANNKEYVRQEMAESARYIDRTCGRDHGCRQRLEVAEMMRIQADLREQQARRDRFAAAMRQASENQARISAAHASQPIYQPQPAQVIQPPRTTQTNCWRSGQNINCQTY